MSERTPDMEVKDPTLQKTEDVVLANGNKFSTKTGQLRQIIVALVVSMLFVIFSMPLGYSAIFLPQIRDPSETIVMDLDMESWFASIYSLGMILGACTTGVTVERFGRLPTLKYPLILTIIGWICIGLANSNTSLLVGRFLIGFSNSMSQGSSQVYMSECSDPKLRGSIGNLGFVAFSLGVLMTYTLGAFLHWRWVAWWSMALPLVTFFVLFYLPETPTWLVYHGKKDEANKVLTWLRGDATLAKEELDDLQRRYEAELRGKEEQKETFLAECLKISSLKPILFVISFLLLLQLTGTYIIVFYSVDILSELGKTIDGITTSVTTSVVRLLSTLAFCAVFHYFARRTIYIWTGMVGGISLASLGFYIMVFIGDSDTIIDFYVACVLITIYIAVNTGYLLARSTAAAEMLPAKIRGPIFAYFNAILNLTFFFCNKMFPFLLRYLGVHGIFFIFAGSNAIAVALTYFFMPETMNRSLGEIEDYFKQDGWLYKRFEADSKKDVA